MGYWRRISPVSRLIGNHTGCTIDGVALAADVVGSSRYPPAVRKRIPMLLDEYAHRTFRQYDALAHNGVGDGVSAVFPQTNNAIESKFRLEELMRGEGFQLRAAVACSSLTRSFRLSMQGYDYDGDARIIAARIMSLARPNELLADQSLLEAGQVDLDRYRFRATYRTLAKAYIDRRPGEPERLHPAGEVVLFFSVSRGDGPWSEVTAATPIGWPPV